MGKLSKDRRDVYYRRAKTDGFRARSAFKLVQLDDEFQLLDGITRAVDLCAAPGSWSQVLIQRLKRNHHETSQEKQPIVVAVDLQEMAPIDGVVIIKGDITQKETIERITREMGGRRAQIVVSDGAPDVTGLHSLDEYVQLELLLCGLCVSTFVLELGGKFVGKIFRGRDVTLLYAQFEVFFDRVWIAKPQSSRVQSVEAFVVGEGFRMPIGYQPTLDLCRLGGSASGGYNSNEPMNGPGRAIVRFAACGDLSDPNADPDKSYKLEKDATFLSPVQPPIHPAYEEALEHAKQKSL